MLAIRLGASSRWPLATSHNPVRDGRYNSTGFQPGVQDFDLKRKCRRHGRYWLKAAVRLNFIFSIFVFMGDIPKIHDNFIRSILSDKGIAVDYFTDSLPTFIRDRLDFSTLEQLPDSYVSEELRQTVSDIVYSCRRKDVEDGVKVSLLIEHKSFVDRHAPLQIGSYIFSGMLKQVRNGEKPSLIIPVLLYHGRDKWQYHTLKDLFVDMEPGWQKYIPDFDYIYHNLGEVPDEQLETLNNNSLKASLVALRHGFERGWKLPAYRR